MLRSHGQQIGLIRVVIGGSIELVLFSSLLLICDVMLLCVVRVQVSGRVTDSTVTIMALEVAAGVVSAGCVYVRWHHIGRGLVVCVELPMLWIVA